MIQGRMTEMLGAHFLSSLTIFHFLMQLLKLPRSLDW